MWWGFIELLLFPPGGVLLLVLAGLIWWHRPVGRVLAGTGLIVLYLASAPSVSGWLASGLQNRTAAGLELRGARDAGAIVVLAGGSNAHAPEYGGATVSDRTLERIRYGARLQQVTGLPLLVTGGDPASVGVSEAALMATALTRDFGAEVTWIEGNSRNTEENARYSYQLLMRSGIDRIIVVTSALHMRRVLESFGRAGFATVIPAPTSFVEEHPAGYHAWLPNARALLITHGTLHEYVGFWWYRLRYGGG
ncbi:MAG: YdcF family protein [Aquisalimonadaceae bacterium]